MKFSKRKFVVFLALLTVLLTPVLAAASARGNTPGNLGNGMGHYAWDGQWIYYAPGAPNATGLFRMRADGSERMMLSPNMAARLNVFDGWVFYVTTNTPDMRDRGIFKVRTDGTGASRVSYDRATHIAVVDGWIYYLSPTAPENTIVRLSTDGNTRQEITVTGEIAWRTISVIGEWIYYNNARSSNFIYRVNINGTGNSRFLNSPGMAGSLLDIDGWLYYSTAIRGTINRVRPDGTGMEVVSSDNLRGFFNTCGDWLYYFSDRNGMIYRMRPDGTDKSRVSDRYEAFNANPSILVAGNRLFFYARDIESGRMDEFSIQISPPQNVNIPDNMPPPGEIRVLLNGNPVAFDVAPQIIGGRTMVPMRAIFEALGAEVEWHQETSSVTAVTADGAVIRLTIGMDTIYVNDIADTMDVAPQIIEGRTFVPARFVAQAVGANVDWDGDNREVIINS